MTSTDELMEEVHNDRDEVREQVRDEAQTQEQSAAANETTPDNSVKRPSEDVDASAPELPEEPQDQTEEETEAPPAKRRALCGVCDTEAAKYKCSRCLLGYCSLACSRKHQENHPPDEPKAARPQPQPAETETETETKKAKPVHPFQVLDDAPELQRLFKEYPRLPARLRSIHDATLPPRGGSLGLGRGRGGRGRGRGGMAAQPWTKEIGLLQGQKALRRARVDPTEDGDAVRAYCEVVTFLLGKGAAEAAAASANATSIVRAELEAEGTQVIQQLLDAEGRQ